MLPLALARGLALELSPVRVPPCWSTAAVQSPEGGAGCTLRNRRPGSGMI
jgi:hypothetical protein